jgi:hypothetical protein
MVENVRYTTCPGARVSTLATDEGLYVKEGGVFILKGYFPKPEAGDQNERIVEIVNKCDWQVVSAPQLEKLLPPTASELKLLRSFDPENVFLR